MSGVRTYPPVPTRLTPAGGAAGGTPGTTQGGQYYPPIPGGGGTAGGPSNGGPGAPGAPGVAFNPQAFIQAYANMVARTWMDDTYRQLVVSNPADTLAQAGMPTIAGAVVRVVQHQITGSDNFAQDFSRGGRVLGDGGISQSHSFRRLRDRLLGDRNQVIDSQRGGRLAHFAMTASSDRTGPEPASSSGVQAKANTISAPV